MKVNVTGLSNWASEVTYTLDKLGFSYTFYLDYIDDTEFLIARIWQCTVNISTTDIMVDICSLSKLHSYLSYKQECNFDIYL